MKAIETVYNGYKFRSRLEARWAVFFDTLGVKYQYEPEGFDLDGCKYLPDFWIDEWNCWVEIKPIEPILNHRVGGDYSSSIRPKNERPYQLCKKLARSVKKHVLLIGGQPYQSEQIIDYQTKYPCDYSVALFSPDIIPDNPDWSPRGVYCGLGLTGLFFNPFGEEFYNSSSYLYGFINNAYQENPDWFDKAQPSRGDVFGLIEADKIYFKKRYGVDHPNWFYGIARAGFTFNYHINFGVSLRESSLNDYEPPSPRLERSFIAARQARFEHNQ